MLLLFVAVCFQPCVFFLLFQYVHFSLDFLSFIISGYVVGALVCLAVCLSVSVNSKSKDWIFMGFFGSFFVEKV